MKHESPIINHQSSIINPKGFTLVEVIIFVVVAGVVASTIFIPLMTALKGSMFPEKVATATYLAQQRMEFFTKNSYGSEQLSIISLTDYTSADISGYQWRWEISHVDEDLANSLVDAGYKLILVRVKDPDGGEIELQTVVTLRPADE